MNIVALFMLILTAFYPMLGEVIEISKESNTVMIADCNGNCWEFYGSEDWDIGDFCACIMYNSGTPGYIYDDEIIDVRYSGTPDMFGILND